MSSLFPSSNSLSANSQPLNSRPSPPFAPPWLRLQLDHASASFHLQLDITLHAPWTVLFGPSGSGKTTILRALAGIFTPDAGSIQFQSESFLARKPDHRPTTNISPQARRIGLVTQTPALFPHLSAAANIAFSLAHLSATERRTKVHSLLQIFDAESFHDRFPHQLSGGQQQRIALARTLAAEPRLLLLDEPFSAIDRSSRQQILSALRAWVQQRSVPVLLVTHDLAEAYTASDEVILLEAGRAVAQGPASLVLSKARTQLLQELGI